MKGEVQCCGITSYKVRFPTKRINHITDVDFITHTISLKFVGEF